MTDTTRSLPAALRALADALDAAPPSVAEAVGAAIYASIVDPEEDDWEGDGRLAGLLIDVLAGGDPTSALAHFGFAAEQGPRRHHAGAAHPILPGAASLSLLRCARHVGRTNRHRRRQQRRNAPKHDTHRQHARVAVDYRCNLADR